MDQLVLQVLLVQLLLAVQHCQQFPLDQPHHVVQVNLDFLLIQVPHQALQGLFLLLLQLVLEVQ